MRSIPRSGGSMPMIGFQIAFKRYGLGGVTYSFRIPLRRETFNDYAAFLSWLFFISFPAFHGGMTASYSIWSMICFISLIGT